MRVRGTWPRWVLSAYLGIVVVLAAVLAIAYRHGELDGALQDVYNTTGSRLTGLVSIGDFMLWSASIAVALFAAGLVAPHLDGGRLARRLLLGAAAVAVVFAIDDVLAIHELFGRTVASALGRESQKGLLEAIPLGLEGLLLLAFAWVTRDATSRFQVRPLLLLVFLWLGLSVAIDLVPESIFERLVPGGDDGAEGIQTASEELFKLLGIVTWLAFVALAARRAILERLAAVVEAPRDPSTPLG